MTLIYGRIEEQALLRQCLTDCMRTHICTHDNNSKTASATTTTTRTSIQSTYNTSSNSSNSTNNLVLIRGESGIGKSFLVENTFQRRSHTADDCFYAHGKCEELRRNVPFFSLVEALEVLCDAIIDEDADSEAIIKQLQARFSSTVTGKLIPRFSSIRRLLGYPVVTSRTSAGTKMQQRTGSANTTCCSPGASSTAFCKQLNSELRDFLSIVSSTKPIVLFLDDVQWSCLQTLETIQYLTSEPSSSSSISSSSSSTTKEQVPQSNLLVVVAMRDDSEIPSQLQHLPEQHEIHLKALSHSALSELVAYQLKDDKVDNDDLTQVLRSRTGGNPLFASQLLDKLIVHDKLVYRHPQLNEWMWDLRRIRAETSVTDNIVDLLIRKIRNLSPCAQHLLMVAACTGSKFPIEMVKAVVVSTSAAADDVDNKSMGYSRAEFEASLTQIVKEGMLDQQPRHGCYKFAHDRVQQASYELVPKNSFDSMHLRIGRSILQTMPSARDEHDDEDKTSAWILVATEQLNRSCHLIYDQMEKVKLAKLNLSSAMSASQQSAFLWAANYCQMGLKLLGDYRWETQPVLTKQLSKLLAEMEHCLGNREESQALVEMLLTKIDSLQEKLPVYIIKMETLSSEGHLDIAIQVGLDVLGQLGHFLPKKATMRHILTEVVKTKMLLRGMTDESMLELPELTNVSSLGSLEIMSLLGCYAYSANEALFMLLLSQREMRIVLKEGLNKFAGDAFASYGVLMGHLGNVKEAHRFSEISLKLMKRFDFRDRYSQNLLVNHFFLQHLRKPVHDSINPLFQSYELGMEAGDIHNASLAFLSYICCYTNCGLPLGPVIQDTVVYRMQLGECSQDLALRISDVVYQSMLNLRHPTANPVVLDGEVMQEASMLQFAAETNNSFIRQMVYHQKAVLAIYFNDFDAAGEIASQLWVKSSDLVGSCTFTAGATSFLFALSALGVCHGAKPRKYMYYRRAARKYTKKVESWVKQGNPNVHHMLLILRAEEAYVRKDKMNKVKQLYDTAISVSRRSGFTHNAALVSERCGRFLIDYGDADWAQDYLQNAHVLYTEWGALGKKAQMEKEFEWLKGSMHATTRRGSTNVKGICRFDDAATDSSSTRWRTRNSATSASFNTAATDLINGG